MIRSRDEKSVVVEAIDGLLDEWGGVINEPAPSTWGGARAQLNKIAFHNSLPSIGASDGGVVAREKINVLLGMEGYRQLDLDFLNDQYLLVGPGGSSGPISGILNFTRPSIGTYFDDKGVLRTATVDAPRFDHDPVTGERLGLLIEQAATNLMTRSEEFDQPAWTNYGDLAVTPDAGIAPNGTASADKLNGTGSGSVAHYVSRNFTITANAAYVVSFFLRPAEVHTVRISAYHASGYGSTADYDLASGEVLRTSTVGDPGFDANPQIQKLRNGWVRISMRFRNPIDLSTALGLYLTDGLSVNYDAEARPGGIYAWGAQLEMAENLSSYISTTTAAVTRVADTASVPNTGWCDLAEGTLLYEGQQLYAPNLEVFLAALRDTVDSISTLSSLSLYPDFRVFGRARTYNAGPILFLDAGPVSPGKIRGGIAYDGSGMRVCANGGPLGTGPRVYIDVSDLWIGQSAIGGSGLAPRRINGHVARVTYLARAMSDAELQSWSAL